MEKHACKIIDNWVFLRDTLKLRYVCVNEEKIDEYVNKLKVLEKKQVHWDFECIHPYDDFAFARFALVTSAVNFCYKAPDDPTYTFTVKEGDKNYKGAMAMFRCFFRAFENENITSKNLQDVFRNLSSTKLFFSGLEPIPMLEQRYWIIRELITVLEDKYDNDPINIYEESNWDAIQLIDNLSQDFPLSFQDVSFLSVDNNYLMFPFFKKAKLALLLYKGRSTKQNSQLKPLTNFHQIIAVEDYRVPQYLHHIGILEYTKKLESIIQNQKIIFPHQQMEIEIRAATTFANKLILEKLNRDLSSSDKKYWHIANLDAHEWFGAQSVDFPHHITPTTAY